MGTQKYVGSRSPAWSTPRWVVDFGAKVATRRYNLDVCAEPHNTRCKRFIDLFENAFETPWRGHWWCNPPYGEISKWLARGFAEHDRLKDKSCGTFLLPARTGTKWFREYAPKSQVVFLRGRVKFEPPTTYVGKASGPQEDSLMMFVGYESLALPDDCFSIVGASVDAGQLKKKKAA